MKYIHIRNWEKFQHYKDRSPTWIKVHRTILDRYDKRGEMDDFYFLDPKPKCALILLWVLASRHNGIVPYESDQLLGAHMGYLDDDLGQNIGKLCSYNFIIISNVRDTKLLQVAVQKCIKAPKAPKPEAIIEFPAGLDTHEFRKAWNDRIDCVGKKISAGAKLKHMGQCEAWGLQRAIAALVHSMTWQALIEPNGNNTKAWVQPKVAQKCRECGSPSTRTVPADKLSGRQLAENADIGFLICEKCLDVYCPKE